MKKSHIILFSVMLLSLLALSCRDGEKTETGKAGESPIAGDLIKIGSDIITEVIVKPLSGDPWEEEKVKGFKGDPMFLNLLEKINRREIKVYDCITGEPFSEEEAIKVLNETGTEVSKITKLQFTEDWYFNPSTNEVIKKVKSVSFGYENLREQYLPPAYKPYFLVKPE